MNRTETDYAIMTFDDGIVTCTYKDKVVLDLDAAKAIIKQRKETSDYKAVPALVDARHVKQITKESRDYFNRVEGSELLTAVALVASSVLTRHLGNFFIKITYRKGKVPIQLFSDIDKAIEWLKKYRLEEVES
ncbi:MAG: hypothetical protein MI810_22875 [Flavobacteriales bacterium]|nr:hypothetical protein [Flavobacteriales bacterium]